MAYSKSPDRLAPLKDKLKSPGAPGGAWLLCGPEAYLSAYYLSQIRKKVIPDPDLGYFDHIRLSGGSRPVDDFDGGTLAARLASAVEGLPVMNESKLIEIAEPGFPDMKAAELKEFCAVLEGLEDFPYVTLVICCAEEEFPTDFRSETGTLWKTLEASGLHIVPFPLQTKAKLLSWCAKHFASEQIEAAPGVIEAMIDRAGQSMTALAGEMQKLCAYLHAASRTVVTRDDVMLVCCTSDTAEDFAISNAVRGRDMQRLADAVRILKNEKTDPMMLFFQISSAITELWRIKTGLADGYSREELMKLYKIKEYPMRLAIAGCERYSLAALTRLMERCAQTDIQLKSSPLDSEILLDRLICALSPRHDEI